MSQNLTWTVSVDPAIAEAAMRSLATTAETSTKQIEASVRREAATAIAEANREFTEVKRIHAEKVRLAEQESKEIQAIHSQKTAQVAREADREFKDIQRIHLEKLKLAAQEAAQVASLQSGVGKAPLQNYLADLTLFQNALKGNSATARTAADDFLRLLGPVGKVGHESGVAAHEVGKISEVFRAVASSAVIAEGPLGGVAGRLRAVGAESTELSSLIGPGGLIVGGLLAVGFGAVFAADALFKLDEKAAAYGEEIYKAKIVTGLTAEQLSVLKVIAGETNTPFETLTSTAAKLQVGISKGITQPSGEAGHALKLLKLDNEAFKNSTPEKQLQAVAKGLNEVTNQSDKNRASQALLKKGFIESADALKVIGEGYDEAAKKADAFGLMMSERDVEAAHQFHEALKDLGLGVEGLGIQIGQRTIPAIEASMDHLAKALGLNESSWKSWGEYIGNTLSGVVINVSASVALINAALNNIRALDAKNTAVGDRIVQEAGSLFDYKSYSPSRIWNDLKQDYSQITPLPVTDPIAAYSAEQLRMQKQIAASTPPGTKTSTPGTPQFGGGGGGGGRGGGKHGESEAHQETMRQLKEEEIEVRKLEGAYSEATDKIKHDYDQRLQSFGEYIAAHKAENDKLQDEIIQQINAEQAALDASFAKKAIKQKEYDDANDKLTAQNAKAKKDHDKEALRLDETEYKEQLKLHKQYIDTINAADDARDARRMTRLDLKYKAGIIDEVAYEDQLYKIKLEGNARDKKVLDDEIEQLIARNAKVLGITKEAAARTKVVQDAIVAQRKSRNQISDDEDRIIDDATERIRAALARRAELYVRMDTDAANQLRFRNLNQRQVDLQRLIDIEGVNSQTLALARQLSRDEAQEHHVQVMDEIATQEAKAHAIDVGEKHKSEIEARYKALRAQENERFKKENGAIDANPLSLPTVKISSKELLFGTQLVDVFNRIKKAVHDAGGEMSNFKIATLTVGKTAADFFHQQSANAGDFESIMRSASANVVSGLVDIGKQWILTGHTGTSALRKLVAETLAAIFQQSIIKAAWEGAEALAEYAIGVSLASNPFTAPLAPPHFAAATAHGTAAAAYAALGLGAGVLGRFAAGGAFQQGSSGAGGSGSGSSGSGSSSGSSGGSSNNQGNSMTLGSQRQEVIHKVVVTIKTERGFIAEKFLEELRGNDPKLTRAIQGIADRSSGG